MIAESFFERHSMQGYVGSGNGNAAELWGRSESSAGCGFLSNGLSASAFAKINPHQYVNHCWHW
jgi:hypothetical protein